MFAVLARLLRHLRVHTGEKPFKCNICNRAFEHSGKLHRHMRTHTGERPHRCGLCGKTFVQSGQLVIHMRAHTGEKPYTCDYCHKGFTCSKQLKVHTRTHTGEKPYECDVCGKTFGYNHVLKMHKMSHLGEKLYKCTLCEEFFNSRKALDRHIKGHDEDPFASLNGKEGSKEKGSKPPKKGPRAAPNMSIPPPLCSLPQDYDGAGMDHLRLLDPGHPAHPRYPVGRRGVVPGQSCSPLTPPRSPECPASPLPLSQPPPLVSKSQVSYSMSWAKSAADKWDPLSPLPFALPPGHYPPAGSLPPPPPPPDPSQLAFFTTVSGERIACPAHHVIRLPGPAHSFAPDASDLHKEFQESLQIRQELKDRLRFEEQRKQRESSFFTSVLKVMESCIGPERLQKLGYPEHSIDEVIINTLKLMGTTPCWEPSLAPMDRIKVNLRLLLECCVPDQDLWNKFGWRGKSIEDIVSEFLSNSN
ncbi:UNVERIFIED_CONTAM: hypothetical protein GTU68_035186 [Idotea baltica]|nr:hypothetical protein [Idotea baltica]